MQLPTANTTPLLNSFYLHEWKKGLAGEPRPMYSQNGIVSSGPLTILAVILALGWAFYSRPRVPNEIQSGSPRSRVITRLSTTTNRQRTGTMRMPDAYDPLPELACIEGGTCLEVKSVARWYRAQLEVPSVVRVNECLRMVEGHTKANVLPH